MSLPRCPHCNNPLTLEERKGRNCPACGKSLTGGSTAEEVRSEAPRQTSSPRGEAYWDKPTPSSYQAPGWGTVRTSLALVALGWLFMQINVVVGQIITANPPKKPSPGLFVLVQVLNFAAIVGGIYVLTGLTMSLAAPGDALGKLFGIAVVLALVVGLICFITLLSGEARAMVRTRDDKSEPWKPETFKILGYVLVISIFLGMVLYGWFQWAVARRLQQSGLSVGILIFVVLELAGIITLFILAAQQESFMTPSRRGMAGYLAVPIQMLLLHTKEGKPNWFVLGVSIFLCLWFVVQSFLLRHAVTRGMTRERA